MPDGVVAGGLDVEPVLEHECAAVAGSDCDEHSGDQAEYEDDNWRMCHRVVPEPAQTEVDEHDHGHGHHDRGVTVHGATRLGSGLTGAPPVPETSQRRRQRDKGASGENEGRGLIPLVAPRVVTTCERDQIEDAYEQIGGDRDVRERRMSRFAGQAAESLELAALERQRGSEREVAHVLPPFERLALCGEGWVDRPADRPW